MLSAIYLDHQHRLAADEVGDVATDRILPNELCAVEPTVTDQVPELALGFSLGPAQLASPYDATRRELGGPPPSPLPIGERGRWNRTLVPYPLQGEGPCKGLSNAQHFHHFWLGKLNSAPPLMPAGQREVTVLMRV